MDFFTIRVKADEAEAQNRFAGYLHDAVSSLHSPEAALTLSEVSGGTVEAVVNLPGVAGENKPERLIDLLSLGLAKYIVHVKEDELLGRILNREYEWTSREEMEIVKDICRELLEQPKDGIKTCSAERRVLMVFDALREYLHSEKHLHLDGFAAFRLKEYEGSLREAAELAVDEYLLDKQYEEFISLLQYFVYFQEPLTPLVHLMHKQGHEFAILNEQFSPIQLPSSGGVVARIADQEMEMEDVIVSTLISLSPDRILIHTQDPGAQVIETLSKIFGERVEICLLCPQCKLFHREVRRLDQGT
ncbi:sporulation protein [Paenibacillus oralis]|uniref:Sporulation protein n=1 Tax=Paenibacillus oralis TaxID=2490856 RepID=A0A3P3U2W4_9BACL|nr:putative sporulation protein YtxC [Paenibacillus oralis]RRJ64480.1 sporulation protein [Paenibacillus oralis]